MVNVTDVSAKLDFLFESQLFMTTHGVNLLNEDFIRRGCIWFTEKNDL